MLFLNPSIFPLYMPPAASSLPTALLLSVLRPLSSLVLPWYKQTVVVIGKCQMTKFSISNQMPESIYS
ncbi:hypothetical protein DMH88_04215 [Escherichia coli]|nr:hypothetical protein [Escherichia coli]